MMHNLRLIVLPHRLTYIHVEALNHHVITHPAIHPLADRAYAWRFEVRPAVPDLDLDMVGATASVL
jgi:hypothetical protein